MALFDVASERLERQARREFVDMVEAVRTGTVIASNREAADAWRRSQSRQTGSDEGQTPAAFRSTLARLTALAPDAVKVH